MMTTHRITIDISDDVLALIKDAAERCDNTVADWVADAAEYVARIASGVTYDEDDEGYEPHERDEANRPVSVEEALEARSQHGVPVPRSSRT
jgi:hypothetical protein